MDVSGAVAEATAELNATADPTPAADSTPAADPTPEPEAKPAETKAEPAAKAPEPDDEEEFYNPTAEELAAIEASPELKKAYRALRKGFTAKTTELANQRKALAEKASLADWIEANPEQAARALAKHTGLSIAEAREQIAGATGTSVPDPGDAIEAKWAKTIGPEAAKLLRPLIDETIEARIRSEVEPLRAATAQLTDSAQRRGIAASISKFGADRVSAGDEWTDEVQTEMAKVAARISPGDDTPIEEFLETVYDKVMYKRMKLKSAKENLNRLKRIRDEAEPTTTSRSTPPDEESVTVGMNDNDAVALAVKLARKASR